MVNLHWPNKTNIVDYSNYIQKISLFEERYFTPRLIDYLELQVGSTTKAMTMIVAIVNSISEIK